MGTGFNLTHITVSGFVEMSKYRYLYFFTMLIVYVLIICSNSTVVYVIWMKRDLHKPMYVFIAALLFNTVIYSSTFYPKLLVDCLSEDQTMSYSACLFQFFMFYTGGGSESFLLAAMAYDRYVSICEPLRYEVIMSKTVVTALLALAWFVPVSHVSVLTILSTAAEICNFNLEGIFCNNSMYKLHCVRSKALTVLGAITLVDMVMLPIFFTVFTYTKIFVVSYRSCKELRSKAAETCLPHLLVLFIFFYQGMFDVIAARVELDFPKIARLFISMQMFLYHPLFNPFIYGLKMKEISKHIKKMFCPAKNTEHVK